MHNVYKNSIIKIKHEKMEKVIFIHVVFIVVLKCLKLYIKKN